MSPLVPDSGGRPSSPPDAPRAQRHLPSEAKDRLSEILRERRDDAASPKHGSQTVNREVYARGGATAGAGHPVSKEALCRGKVQGLSQAGGRGASQEPYGRSGPQHVPEEEKDIEHVECSSYQ